jgi:hypothetical protein
MARRIRSFVARLIARLTRRPQVRVPEGLRDLAQALETQWPDRLAALRGAGVPLMADDDSADADADKDSDADSDGKDDDAGAAADADKDDDEEKDDDSDGTPATVDAARAEVKRLRGEIQKHRGTERRAKNAEKEKKALEAKLKEFEDRDKTEQEKAIEKARKDAETEVTSKYETQRRDDKIESAVTKLALGGFKVGEGDDQKTLKFADIDDAQLRLDRALRNGDLSYDDIYSDGKVDRDAVRDFLTEVLEEHPRLQDGGGGASSGRRVEGGADAGKGKGGGGGQKTAAQLAEEMAIK